jgi:ribosomal peptide maturation radical SAM protein 1
MPDACLVSMPFTPVSTPGLGVSILSAALREAGLSCDVHYGAFSFFHAAHPDPHLPASLYDYNFLASNQDLGDLFFAPLLWGTSGDEVEAALDRLAGHHNHLFEPGQLRDVVERLRVCAARMPEVIDHVLAARDWSSYRVVGISSTFSQNIGSLVFARELRRRHPGVHIVFGGANCDGEMGVQLLESFPWIDAVLQGEAELSFPEYVQRVLTGDGATNVAGALVREDGRVVARHPAVPLVNLDRSPQPVFDDFFAQLPPVLRNPWSWRELSLPIETSRGCWWGAVHHCTFCGLNPATMTFRAKSPERAVGEFRVLRDRYRQRRFTAVDNIISLRYFEAVLPLLEEEDLDIFYETKANLTEAQVRRLARAGVRTIQPGIEGFSSEILALMKKGVRGYQNLELLKWCSIYQVIPIWFYLYRFPHEPHEPYFRDTVRMRRWMHLPPPRNPNPVVIDRYSPLYSGRDAVGLSNLRPSGYAASCYSGLSESEQMRICYHFDADLPQGNDLPYENGLWQTISDWNLAYAAGARLYQFGAPASTLIVDTRRENARCFLLSGEAHDLYSLMRTAHPRELLTERLSAMPRAELTFDDLELSYLGGLLNAMPIAEMTTVDDLLAVLEREWLAESLDGRLLALAVDCTSRTEAERFGLGKFMRVLDGAEAPRVQHPTDEDILQLLQEAHIAT